MYNWSYINAFRNKGLGENIYRDILENPSMLKKLEKEYLAKYSEDANAFYLALKESLDHYVAMRIAHDKNYVSSQQFQNYAKYLKNIIQNNKYECNGKTLYIEPSMNVVFNYLDENTLNTLYPGNTLKSHIDYNKKILDTIFKKIEQNAVVTQEELSLASIYLDNTRDYKSGRYKAYMHYIFDHLDSINATPQIVSGIISCLPNYYMEGVENTRTFIGSKDYDKTVNWGHSKANFGYTVLQYNRFKNIDLKSTESANSSRTYNSLDIIFLIFIENHELSHQRQKIQMEKGNSFEGAAWEINKILNSEFDDYKVNHDSDEIEIDADERGWKKTRQFLSDYYQREDKKDLLHKCFKNTQAVNCRRAFSVKADPTTGKTYRYIDYDMARLIEVVRKYPEKLQNYPHLKEVFSPSGKINLDFLFNNLITLTPAGRELCNYILNNIPDEVAIAAINSGKYTARQVENFIENLVQVPHENALTLRDIQKTDLKTFEETVTKIDIKHSKNDVYNYYFAECAEQLIKFSTILEAAKGKYESFDQSYVNSQYKFFVEYYYVEMLENIESPNMELINSKMQKYQKSDNKILTHLAKYTKSYLNRKIGTTNTENLGQIPSFSSNDSNSINTELQDMLNSVNGKRDTHQLSTSTKK